jgi:hypothetical protein
MRDTVSKARVISSRTPAQRKKEKEAEPKITISLKESVAKDLYKAIVWTFGDVLDESIPDERPWAVLKSALDEVLPPEMPIALGDLVTDFWDGHRAVGLVLAVDDGVAWVRFPSDVVGEFYRTTKNVDELRHHHV